MRSAPRVPLQPSWPSRLASSAEYVLTVVLERTADCRPPGYQLAEKRHSIVEFHRSRRATREHHKDKHPPCPARANCLRAGALAPAAQTARQIELNRWGMLWRMP